MRIKDIVEGHHVVPGIDRERYTDLSHHGLEGPFHLKSGKVVYYDPKEGKYYDRDTDMYMSHEDHEYHMREEATGKVTKSDTSGVEITAADGVKTTLPADKAIALTPDANTPGEYDLNPAAVAPADNAAPKGPAIGATVDMAPTSEATDEDEKDTIADGGGDIGGDPTDDFIDDVVDHDFEKASKHEGRGDWDTNASDYQGDYGGSKNWGRREREDDEGYARTKDADDAHNRSIGRAHRQPSLPKPKTPDVRESSAELDRWKRIAGLK